MPSGFLHAVRIVGDQVSVGRLRQFRLDPDQAISQPRMKRLHTQQAARLGAGTDEFGMPGLPAVDLQRQSGRRWGFWGLRLLVP
jgi:hypothetical protein